SPDPEIALTVGVPVPPGNFLFLAVGARPRLAVLEQSVGVGARAPARHDEVGAEARAHGGHAEADEPADQERPPAAASPVRGSAARGGPRPRPGWGGRLLCAPRPVRGA